MHHVVGLRSWQVPQGTIADAIRGHPRADFKVAFICTRPVGDVHVLDAW
jgi:hypothetical protein